MGESMVEEGRKILMEGGIPNYNSPEEAINAFLKMHKAAENREFLLEPDRCAELPKPDVYKLRKKLIELATGGRQILSEVESKELLESYGIKTTLPRLAKTPKEAAGLAKSIGYPVVMKVQSEDISHKSDANCVMLNISDEATVMRKYDEIMANARAYNPKARIDGITLQKMVSEKGFEVILGSKRDPLFGPAVLFGMGGIAVEAIKDTSLELAPLTTKTARVLIDSTKISRLLRKGFRNLPPANMACLEETALRFSQLVSDLPEIKEMDINPLRVDDRECIVLDARVVLNK
jgi:acetyltransferase